MVYTFILNPEAGNGAARRNRSVIEKALQQTSLEVNLLTTEGPGDASVLAQQAAETSDVIVAIGGDGTVHEVSEGIIKSNKEVSLGVIPVGTGNDFVKMIRMSLNPRSAVVQIETAKPCLVDYGRVRWWEGTVIQDGIFVNAVGTGFDAQVARAVKKYTMVTGVTAYLLAVLSTLRHWQSPHAVVRITNKNQTDENVFSSSLFLATAGNGVCSGGGFYLTPDASICDGKLDVCFIRGLSIPRVLSLIPRALRGKHVGAPEVTMARADFLSVQNDTPQSIHADGELLSRNSERMEVQIIPNGLSVLMPVATTA